MEIKINITSSEEDRKNVELFEFRRRKEEDFKHKIEEQMDSLISQNEKEKSRIKDEIRKLEIILTKKNNCMNWQMNFWGDFTKKTALSNYTILMMLNIRGERKLSFFVCNAIAQTIGRDSSDRERERKPAQRVSAERINVYT